MRRCDGSVGSVIGVTLAGTTNSKSERPPPAALRKHPDTLIWGGPETRDQRSLSQEDDVSYRRVRFRERELSRKFQNREPANLRFPLPASIQRRSCGRNRMQKKNASGFLPACVLGVVRTWSKITTSRFEQKRAKKLRMEPFASFATFCSNPLFNSGCDS